MQKYGSKPKILGEFKDIKCQEMMFYMYMPIKMAMTDRIVPSYYDPHFYPYVEDLRYDKRLDVFRPLIDAVVKYEGINIIDSYVYITAKHTFVSEHNAPNRPGWHSDGYLTDDLNYIFYDKFPTEICIQDFNLTPDHTISLKEMEEQVKEENIITYEPYTLIRLDQYNIHRVPLIKESGMRTFVKITVSKEKYNLIGNTHNHFFDYNWDMKKRDVDRNHPTK